MGFYDAGWKKYRRLRTTYVLLWMGILPFLWILHLLGKVPNVKMTVGPLIFKYVLYALALAVAMIRLERFRCPRCGDFFAITRRYSLSVLASLLAPKCVHCGLEKFSDGEQESTASAAPAPTSS